MSNNGSFVEDQFEQEGVIAMDKNPKFSSCDSVTDLYDVIANTPSEMDNRIEDTSSGNVEELNSHSETEQQSKGHGEKKVNCMAGCKRARKCSEVEVNCKKICPKNAISVLTIDEKLYETRLSSCNLQEFVSAAESKASHVDDSEIRSESNDYSFNKSIEYIPSSILLNIFSYLSMHDLLNCAAPVCKKWWELSKDPALWRHIKLSGSESISDAALQRITSYSSNVITLDLTDCAKVTADGLIAVLQQCPSLQRLSLVRLDLFRDERLSAIGQLCPQLNCLDLLCCCSISDEVLCRIVQGCSQLTDIRLNQCRLLTDISLTALVRSCKQLMHLKIDQCCKVTDETLKTLCNEEIKLETISTMDIPFSTCGLVNFLKSRGSYLRNLHLSNMMGLKTEVTECIAAHCRNLERLDLSLSVSVSRESFKLIARHCTRLKSLYLVSCNIDDTVLAEISRYCSALETLDVGWCEEVTTDGARRVCESCKSLTYLGLMRCDRVSDAEAQDLVSAYPHVHISTMLLDCRRVIEKARRTNSLGSNTVASAILTGFDKMQ